MADPIHDRFADAPALYAIGALPADERAAFEAHVRDCPICSAELRAFVPAAHALPLALPLVEPPPGLRDRVLTAAVGRPPKEAAHRIERLDLRWLTLAATLVLAAGLAVVWWSARVRMGAMESELRDARVRLAILSASDLTQVSLSGQAPAPAASGRAFLSRSRGAVFTASNLPPLPSGRTYQLWYLTSGAPVSAGLFKPDPAGGTTLTLTPAAGTTPTGLAVSIEPEGGVSAPTGAIYLAGPTH
jgi:anti-sigma-K factor RskA